MNKPNWNIFVLKDIIDTCEKAREIIKSGIEDRARLDMETDVDSYVYDTGAFELAREIKDKSASLIKEENDLKDLLRQYESHQYDVSHPT